ncbi:MAG: hypothetical protein AB7G15_19490 [Alphaproteobacteria bacterium]
MTRNMGFLASICALGMAVAGDAGGQALWPEDDDGYDQYRAEPDRRPPPPQFQPRTKIPIPLTPPQARKSDPIPESTGPINPNQPQAPTKKAARPPRQSMAEDPGILSDQVQREPPPAMVQPPRPYGTEPNIADPHRFESDDFAPNPAPPDDETDTATVPPAVVPYSYRPPPVFYPPPAYYPAQVYAHWAQRRFAQPRYYDHRPYGYVQPYRPGEVEIFVERKRKR